MQTTLNTGDIVEYGLITGVIIEETGEQYLEFALCDNAVIEGRDNVKELVVEDMVIVGHIDTDLELLEVDNTDYDDVW
ncbi:hypothetical protein [Lysinibacillus sp. LZ02]|uniref:hypothetical protein n=1 Tax=Lysinibacillus sp. LZ02 TaxID=3420668 RepID=UPI003D35DD14